MHSFDVININIVGSVQWHLLLALLDINYGGDGNILFKVNTWNLGGYVGVWDVFNQTDLIRITNFLMFPFVFLFINIDKV